MSMLCPSLIAKGKLRRSKKDECRRAILMRWPLLLSMPIRHSPLWSLPGLPQMPMAGPALPLRLDSPTAWDLDEALFRRFIQRERFCSNYSGLFERLPIRGDRPITVLLFFSFGGSEIPSQASATFQSPRAYI